MKEEKPKSLIVGAIMIVLYCTVAFIALGLIMEFLTHIPLP